MYMHKLNRLELEYDPENDLIPNAPAVTHTDEVLLSAIFDLIEVVEKLEEQINEMANKPR